MGVFLDPLWGGGKGGPWGATFLPPGGGTFPPPENRKKGPRKGPPVKTVHHDLSRLGELLNTLKNVHPRGRGVRARTPRRPGMEPPSGGSLLVSPQRGSSCAIRDRGIGDGKEGCHPSIAFSDSEIGSPIVDYHHSSDGIFSSVGGATSFRHRLSSLSPSLSR